MILGLTFATPLLLLGLLAVAIPPLLHLLARARAQEVLFPTLRFLRASVEKTARRRRFQNVLLMALRMLLLLLLALAVAEPITQALGSWVASPRYAAAVLFDNSLSMGARQGAATRLDRARQQAQLLLSGTDKPALAALLPTNAGAAPRELTGRLDTLREQLRNVPLSFGRAPLAAQVATALDLLRNDTSPQKVIYVFSDLQRASFEELLASDALARDEDVHLIVVHANDGPVENVGLRDLRVQGQRVVGQTLDLTAVLTNSSPTDRTVDVRLQVNGAPVGARVRRTLSPVGSEGSSATVRFRLPLTESGPLAGEVILEQTDDLLPDNVRRFALDVASGVRALIVRGPSRETDPLYLAPDALLRIALDPFGPQRPWSVRPQVVESDRFDPASLQAADIVFCTDVPAFTPEQADALARFAAAGGTVFFFLGPDVDPANYNERFVQAIEQEGGLLPGRIEAAVGEIGPSADATPIDWVDMAHPYLAGLYDSLNEYLDVIVQRHYRLADSARPPRVLLRLETGDPLVVHKAFGSGQVVLCTTGASRRWSNLPMARLFVPLVLRAALLSRPGSQAPESYLAGSPVVLRPDLPPTATTASLDVILPPDDSGTSEVVTVPVRPSKEGPVAAFDRTERCGIYQWRLGGTGESETPVRGAFAVNPSGAECDLQPFDPDAFRQGMRNRGLQRTYVGADLASAHASALTDAQGANWWDLLLVLAILTLVAESVVANRLRARADAVPAHLNPRLRDEHPPA